MELTEWKEKALDTVKGELTLKTLDFCLIGAICFLAGICIGMIAAPLTHGVTVQVFSNNRNNGSGNGSKNGNNHGNQYGDFTEDENL